MNEERPDEPSKKSEDLTSKSKRKEKGPDKPRGVAYRIRYADDGTVWHSWVDVDRPHSPPVEWPEYPDEDFEDKFPEELHSAEDRDEMDDYIDKTLQSSPNTELKKGPPDSFQPEIPEEDDIEDDEFGSVHLPSYPGLFPEDNEDDDGERVRGKKQNPWDVPDGEDDFDDLDIDKMEARLKAKGNHQEEKVEDDEDDIKRFHEEEKSWEPDSDDDDDDDSLPPFLRKGANNSADENHKPLNSSTTDRNVFDLGPNRPKMLGDIIRPNIHISSDGSINDTKREQGEFRIYMNSPQNLLVLNRSHTVKRNIRNCNTFEPIHLSCFDHSVESRSELKEYSKENNALEELILFSSSQRPVKAYLDL